MRGLVAMREHATDIGERPWLDLSPAPLAIPRDQLVRLIEQPIPHALVKEVREKNASRIHHVVHMTAATRELETRFY